MGFFIQECPKKPNNFEKTAVGRALVDWQRQDTKVYQLNEALLLSEKRLKGWQRSGSSAIVLTFHTSSWKAGDIKSLSFTGRLLQEMWSSPSAKVAVDMNNSGRFASRDFMKQRWRDAS